VLTVVEMMVLVCDSVVVAVVRLEVVDVGDNVVRTAVVVAVVKMLQLQGVWK
jgi:hypothetical protein